MSAHAWLAGFDWHALRARTMPAPPALFAAARAHRDTLLASLQAGDNAAVLREDDADDDDSAHIDAQSWRECAEALAELAEKEVEEG